MGNISSNKTKQSVADTSISNLRPLQKNEPQITLTTKSSTPKNQSKITSDISPIPLVTNTKSSNGQNYPQITSAISPKPIKFNPPSNTNNLKSSKPENQPKITSNTTPIPLVTSTKSTNGQNKAIQIVLEKINSNFISLPANETKETKEYLTQFLNKFMTVMRESDKLFNAMYRSILYAGSFYDGLKIGKPDEFDLDIIFDLPINCRDFRFSANENYPGFIALQNDGLKALRQHPEWTSTYREMDNWFDKNFFLPDKLRYWLQSVIQKGFNSKKELTIDGAKITVKNSGPAVTLLIRGKYTFDIDLVPVLQMNNTSITQWPPSPVRKLPVGCQKKTWYCVPKPMKLSNKTAESPRFWRLSFQEQEMFLIKGKEALKPALRLLKKFRDTQNFTKIASYYLKTICLWEMEKNENAQLWKQGFVTVFVHLLKALDTAFETKTIPYYWQPKNNLLKVVGPETLHNYSCKMKKILKAIDNDINSLPTFILNKVEYAKFQENQIK